MEESKLISILSDKRVSAILGGIGYSKRRDLLADALLISFKASLYFNEGRQLGFSLLIEHESQKTTKANLFDYPIRLEERYLQSLSPALCEHDECFVVEGGANHSNAMMIVGTAPLPRADQLPPAYLKPVILTVNGPGRIRLEIGDLKIIYDRGIVKESTRNHIDLLCDKMSPFFVNEVSTIGNIINVLKYGLYGNPELDPDSWDSHRSDYINTAIDYCPKLLGGVIEEIVRDIQRADHGGALLFIPPGAPAGNIFQEKRWYSKARLELSEAICKTLALNTIYDMASQGKWIYPKGVLPVVPNDFEFWLESIVYPQLNNSFLNLSRQCQRIASLAGADGAVVLNTTFGLQGFSAKLKSSESDLPRNLADFLDSKGNRHNSMARTVCGSPNSLGIVVSQDGNAVCFSNPEGNAQFFDVIF